MDELWAKIINKLNKTRMTIMGASQKRLRTFRKSHNSLRIDTLDIPFPFKIAGDSIVFEKLFALFFPNRF